MTTTPPTATTIEAVLHRSLLELGIEEEKITPEARLRADLELDSTDIVQVALDLTRHCGTRVKLEANTDYSFDEVCRMTPRAAP